MPYRVTLDNDVMRRIQEFAEPWVDSPNSALRKALQMDPAPTRGIYFEIERVEEDGEPTATNGAARTGTVDARSGDTPHRRRRRTLKPGRRTRAPKGSLLDEKAYWRPILEVLANSPKGAAPARGVIEQVGSMLEDRLKPLDRERLDSGGLRWHTRVMFARFRMKEAGLLKHGSPRGVWEISDRGRDALKDEQLLVVGPDDRR